VVGECVRPPCHGLPDRRLVLLETKTIHQRDKGKTCCLGGDRRPRCMHAPLWCAKYCNSLPISMLRELLAIIIHFGLAHRLHQFPPRSSANTFGMFEDVCYFFMLYISLNK
jgi:hypothetical protein